jgi:poly-gamma-glutamate synthesis protein (capsule biosynthesis protein)
MLNRGAEDILLREGPGGIFGAAAPLIRDADLSLINLEGAVSSRGARAEKTFTFRFSPPVALALGAAGIDGVLLANNHAFDWGTEAFLDTLGYLENARIGVVGAGRDAPAAAAPFVYRRGDLEVRVFGIASFPAERSGWDGRTVAAGENRPGILHAAVDSNAAGGTAALKTALAEESAEILKVVLFHGGNEWTYGPDRATRELYTDIIRSGADLIIGSHPHIVQGFEWVEGKPLFWSLGNFVFPGMEDTGGGDEGLLIRLGFLGKKLVYLEPFPLALSGPRTDIAGQEVLEKFYERSRLLLRK